MEIWIFVFAADYIYAQMHEIVGKDQFRSESVACIYAAAGGQHDSVSHSVVHDYCVCFFYYLQGIIYSNFNTLKYNKHQ